MNRQQRRSLMRLRAKEEKEEQKALAKERAVCTVDKRRIFKSVFFAIKPDPMLHIDDLVRQIDANFAAIPAIKLLPAVLDPRDALGFVRHHFLVTKLPGSIADEYLFQVYIDGPDAPLYMRKLIEHRLAELQLLLDTRVRFFRVNTWVDKPNLTRAEFDAQYPELAPRFASAPPVPPETPLNH
jgi:hypothetical protein